MTRAQAERDIGDLIEQCEAIIEMALDDEGDASKKLSGALGAVLTLLGSAGGKIEQLIEDDEPVEKAAR